MNALRSLFLGLVFGLYALSAHAQWQWKDKDGRLFFSDRPPPADVPEKDIVRRPGQQRGFGSSAPSAEPALGSTNAAVPGGGASAPGGADTALQDKKKQAEAAEASKRKAEEDRNAAMRADNCARAQQAKATMDSGTRMVRMNEKGEREYFDEASTAAESARLQGIINENCR